METRGTRCRFSRKAPQKLSCRVVARRSYSWNYICLIGLQPSKEVFCQAFFQKSGNRVPRVFISPTNHNLTHYVSTYFVIVSELATAKSLKARQSQRARRIRRLPSSVKWVARAAPHLPASPKGSLYMSRAFAALNIGRPLSQLALPALLQGDPLQRCSLCTFK